MSNKTDIASLLPDNTTEQISPKDMRDSFDLVDYEQTQLKHFKATKDFDADISQDNAIAESQRTTGISFTPAVPSSPDDNLKTDHIGISVPMRMEGNQIIPPLITDGLASKELATIGTVTKSLGVLHSAVQNEFMPLLDKDNPTMQLKVSPAGHAAQMQVLNNGHAVASMEWEKNTQEFFFSLSDKDSGALKAQFEIKPDGHAYIGGQRITTTEDGNPSGLFQYDYKIKMSAADPTPSVSHISFDDIDFTKTTKLYINKKDRTKTDMSLFLSAIDKGDYFNIHDNNDINQFVAFDVIGKAVQNGDVFEVPVKHYDDNGTLTDNERVYIHWQKPEFIIATIKNVDEIHGRGLYDGVDVIGAASQGHIIINVLADSLGNLDLSQKDETGRRTDGGKAVGQAIKWHTVNADHLFGTTVPANTLGHDGDLYFKLT